MSGIFQRSRSLIPASKNTTSSYTCYAVLSNCHRVWHENQESFQSLTNCLPSRGKGNMLQSVWNACLGSNMKARRLILLFPLGFFLLSPPSYSQGRSGGLILSHGYGIPHVNVQLRTPLGSHTNDITTMWLGTWKSLKYRRVTGLVKATRLQMDQKVWARVELEGTILGDVIIHESVMLIGRIFVIRGSCAGQSCLIQGWLRRETILSGFYRISDPSGKHYDWGSFQAEPLEPSKGSDKA